MRTTVIVILIIAVAAALGGYFAYYRYSHAAPKDKLSASGVIEAAEITLSSRVSGEVKDINPGEGDKVKKDDLLIELTAPLLVIQKKQAEAGVATAESDVKQAADGTQAEKDAAQAELKQAQAQLDAVDLQLSYTKVKSPMAAAVISIPVQKHENVTPGTPLVVLADLSDLSMKIYISEKNIGRVKLGTKVKVKVDSFPHRTFSGRISKIADKPEFTPANIETKEQRVKLVYAVTVKLGVGGRLKPGMPAEVTFKTIK